MALKRKESFMEPASVLKEKQKIAQAVGIIDKSESFASAIQGLLREVDPPIQGQIPRVDTNDYLFDNAKLFFSFYR